MRLPPSGAFEEVSGEAALDHYSREPLQPALPTRAVHDIVEGTALLCQTATRLSGTLMLASTSAGLAASLCEKCESASARAQQSSQEVLRLSAEVYYTER